MLLFRVSLKSVNSWDKKIRNLYIIEESKEKAIDYVNQYKKGNFTIYRVYYLGYEAGSRMFFGGKDKKK